MSDIIESANRNNCDNNIHQEVKNLQEILKVEHEKFTKCKILRDAIQECTMSNELSDELKNKVENITLECSCAQTLPIECRNFSQVPLMLLGISDKENELNYSESKLVQSALMKILKKKYNTIREEFLEITGHSINNHLNDCYGLKLNSDDRVLLHYKAQLNTQQELYIQQLSMQQNLLEEIMKLRLSKLPQISKEKLKECEFGTKINLLKSKITHEKVRVDIFMETSNSLNAYQELLKDLKKQQEDCKKNIENLEQLRIKYKQVACKQFDELLKSFVQYKSSIEKKKFLFDSLKN